MATNQTHSLTEDDGGTDFVAALYELGELHTVYAFAGTDALNHLDPHADHDEVDAEIYTAETYLAALDRIGAQFETLDSDSAQHVIAGIHAATRHRVALQIQSTREHSNPNTTGACNDPHCRNGETA